jgi:septum formation protein
VDGVARKIILASTSPRRKELLEQIGLEFTIQPSDYEEDMTLSMTPSDLVVYLAKGKATPVAAKNPEAIVVGADTIVAFKDQVLGKPKSAEEAAQTLRLLSGQKNQIITGLCVTCTATGQTLTYTSVTDVYMRDITDQEIDNYVASGQPLDKAGSYAVQDHGGVFIDRVDGDYSAVVGVPLNKLWQFLQQIT